MRALLARHAAKETGDLLDRPPQFTLPYSATTPAKDFGPGDTVGPYRLLRSLGHGGMGEVWQAERADGTLKRKVALKLPHVTWAPGLAERFAREREILSSLEHPNIARLYDAGLDPHGRPYMALEYVEGMSIDAFCNRRALTVAERLRLLLQVADAVAFAHSRLVIHRDLKPGNILVTDDGQARLLDFGIAKLMEGDTTQETALTRVGGRALTIDYASPEQIRGEPIGTSSDVYSLAVVAFELLAGARPYKLKRGSAAELEEAIAHADAPLASAVADEAAVKKQLAGDLDAVLNKALKKSAAERYPTVDALAQDWRRHLAGSAVSARPDTLVYRFNRLLARHRVPVAAAATTLLAFALAFGAGATALVIFVLALGLVAALWQARRASEQARIARNEAKVAAAVQSFLTELFETNSTAQADPLAAQRITARELLDRGAARVGDALRDAPVGQIQVMATLANIYSQLGLMAQSEELGLRRVALARRTFGVRDARLADVLLDCAGALQEGSRRDEIPALLKEAIAALDAAGDTRSLTRGKALREAIHYWRYASLREFRRNADDAAAFFELHHPQSELVAGTHMLAARAQMASFEFEAAIPRVMAALEAAKREGEGAASRATRPMGTLASILSQQMKYEEAEIRHRATLDMGRRHDGEDHPETLILKAQFGNQLLTVGRTSEGQALHDDVHARLASDDTRLDPQMRANLAGLLGRTLQARGRPDREVPLLRADVEDMRETLPNSGSLALREVQLAEAQSALGDNAGARATLALAEDHWRHFADGEPAPLVETTIAIAKARIALDAGDAASALSLLDPGRPATRMDRLRLLVQRSQSLLTLQKNAEAAEAAATALQDLATLPVGSHPVQLEASALQRLGEAQWASGDGHAAVVSLSRAVELRRSHDASGSLWLADALVALARCLTAQGSQEAARALLDDAHALHAQHSRIAPRLALALATAQRALHSP